MYRDWDLIEASFATQYQIRLHQIGSMSWTEFCTLLSGLLPETPLGQVIAIRCEKDSKIIKNFSEDQRRIWKEWRSYQASMQLEDEEQLNKEMEDLYNMFSKAFSGGEVT